MYIKNPNKKESYSFRIKPELLESIKQYAKATNQTVPEILNDLIEETVDGLHLTNDYLKSTMNSTNIIGLPPLMDMYNNGNYKEFGLFFDNKNRVLYEFKRLPNNLDSWTEKQGYTSNKRGLDHEGISFVLAPELITKPEYLRTLELVFCCLVPIYFKISIKKKSVQVKNLSFTNALEKIKASPNIELLDEFTQYTNEVKEIIYKYHNVYTKKGFTTPDYENGIFIRLVNDLKVLSKEINTNIVSHLDGTIERQSKKAENNILLTDNPYILNDEIDRLQNENKTLQNRVNELETKFNKLLEISEKIDNLEERAKIWEELKNDDKNKQGTVYTQLEL